MIDHANLFLRFGIAIAIGFLIGLQREFSHGRGTKIIVAGERTFALIGLVGALAAMAADQLSSPAIFLSVIFLLGVYSAIAYFMDASRGHIGLTSEVTIIVVALLGALCYWEQFTLAVAIGIITTFLLTLKIETDRFVRALTREDFFAALQLAIISAIVLPILPNEHFLAPPFDVLNPFNIWLMVVFISGISFLGYVAIKVVGPEQGIGLTGLLGGLVSSTAVTLSFAERSKRADHLVKPLALAITVAWTVMFARILVEVGVVNKALLSVVWVPISAAGAVGLLYVAYLYFSKSPSEKGDLDFSNPFDLAAALKFGLLYGVVLLVSRTAQMYFGDTGIFLSSFISGMADVDAITLSMAELSHTGQITLGTASRAIVIAAMSNTAVKGGIAIFSGSTALRKALVPAIGVIMIVGLGVAFLV
ncbi:MAG: MgtC/SapB family protein [Chloroflexota bacterium]